MSVQARIICRQGVDPTCNKPAEFHETLLTETLEDGSVRHYCARNWYALADTPGSRAVEVQQFYDRRKRFP